MRLTRLELTVMAALWERGPAAIREIQEGIPRDRRPAYTTVQTIVYRLEAKGAVRRAKKIGNAHVFEAVLTRAAAQTSIVADVLRAFGGRAQPLVAHLVETGQISREDLDDARRRLAELAKPSARKGRTS
jgi:predicted transcriptional regulator